MLSCQRLSLTPLSYLWQRDQAELLSEMISAGMQAVLIKVAGIGLTTKHLGMTLSEMQHTLVKLVGSTSLNSLLMMNDLINCHRIRCMVRIFAEREANTRH
jgi:diphthamide synthase (EF-2-diphthine--ammonia ligase)